MLNHAHHRDERGATTAEYCVGTLGTALLATVVYRVIGPTLLEIAPDVFDLRELLPRMLGPVSGPFIGLRP